jgi:hypothetical protein
MIFNHHSVKHIAHKQHDDFQYLDQIATFQYFASHSVYPSTYFIYDRSAEAGDEIFNYYSADWFDSREGGGDKSLQGQDDILLMSYDTRELKRVGHCVTLVHASESSIPGVGKGVFASTLIKEGEVVQVTPVLMIPKHEAMFLSDLASVLVNYCISHPNSDVAFIPIGSVGISNHGGESANTAIEWYFWDEETRSLLEKEPEELLRKFVGKLYFSYRATRDILEGEEVLIDYGRGWDEDWADFLQKREKFVIFEEDFPLFRRTIDAPEGLFPAHWMVDCFGADCPSPGRAEEEDDREDRGSGVEEEGDKEEL